MATIKLDGLMPPVFAYALVDVDGEIKLKHFVHCAHQGGIPGYVTKGGRFYATSSIRAKWIREPDGRDVRKVRKLLRRQKAGGTAVLRNVREE